MMQPQRTPNHRQSIRLKGLDYAPAGAYFVTIVTQGRASMFGRVVDDAMHLSRRGLIAEECWHLIPRHFPHAELGLFVGMPNHVHGIILLHERGEDGPHLGASYWVTPTKPRGPQRGSVGAIVGAYKMAVTRAIQGEFGVRAVVWQRNYDGHTIRDERDRGRIPRYIESNPMNWTSDDGYPTARR
ncbi:MAG: transposase [Anaerolineales bacterium]